MRHERAGTANASCIENKGELLRIHELTMSCSTKRDPLRGRDRGQHDALVPIKGCKARLAKS
jgi:hypothetical protein